MNPVTRTDGRYSDAKAVVHIQVAVKIILNVDCVKCSPLGSLDVCELDAVMLFSRDVRILKQRTSLKHTTGQLLKLFPERLLDIIQKIG